MIRITKTFHFEAAHALFHHTGACRNIHGHSYLFEVTLIGEPVKTVGSDEGMVMDFAELKAIVNEQVTGPFDHALILNRNYYDANSLPESFKHKIVWLDIEPTCENLLLIIVQRLQPLLSARVKLCSVKLHETVTSFAEWRAEDQA